MLVRPAHIVLLPEPHAPHELVALAPDGIRPQVLGEEGRIEETQEAGLDAPALLDALPSDFATSLRESKAIALLSGEPQTLKTVASQITRSRSWANGTPRVPPVIVKVRAPLRRT
ncbi:MAG: hypothetical protein A2V77_15290 [Anaeromyxobacter sp. RBG_16_69_14]|nr:MAG: hypothetical protein A2V77_15290 [Anaeromyxobacter sp. RBG_16_69_14]